MTVLERAAVLPDVFARWFASRGWAPRAHQLELLAKAQAGRSVLLIAPTGGGKTLAGFLPSLVELSGAARGSPAASGKNENSSQPAATCAARAACTRFTSRRSRRSLSISRATWKRRSPRCGLPIRIETRTGDTPTSKRQRQRRDPPEILLTTPEQLALLLASADAPYLFGSLKRVILDELHALVTSKRGDLLSLGLARLFRLRANLTSVGLSATVAEPDELARFHGAATQRRSRQTSPISSLPTAAPPDVTMLDTRERLPWAGHSARHALDEIYRLIKAHQTTLVFVNTRSQAEGFFSSSGTSTTTIWPSRCITARSTWRSGARSKPRWRAAGCARWFAPLRSISASTGATSIWSSMSARRRALRGFCSASAAPTTAWTSRRRACSFRPTASRCSNAAPRSTPSRRTRRTRRRCASARSTCSRSMCSAAPAASRSCSDELYAEVTTAAPYAALTRADFDAVVDFVATGGYALKAYDRFARIREGKDGRWRITNPNVAQRYRLNVGTIVEADMLKVRLVRSRASKVIPRGGRLLGEVEEYFIETMVPGDTFVFAGEILKYEALVEDEVYVSRATAEDPKVPAYEGGKFPLSTYLAARVRAIIAHPQEWRALPAQVREWLEIQEWRSQMPGQHELLVETFPRANKHYLVCYPFEGRLAHQTLGMLLTRRLERARLRPLGFVANEYALAVWGLGDVAQRIERGEFSLAAPVRRGHAGRRSRSLARRIGADEAHLPQLRDHRRPDRAPLPRTGEIPAAGHDLDRPGL